MVTRFSSVRGIPFRETRDDPSNLEIAGPYCSLPIPIEDMKLLNGWTMTVSSAYTLAVILTNSFFGAKYMSTPFGTAPGPSKVSNQK